VNEPTFHEMLQRLVHLERQARRGKMLIGILLLLLGLVVILGATRSPERTIADEIWAERFVIADKTGKIVGLLGSGSADVGLSLVDRAGRTRLMMTVGADGEPTILLSSARQDHTLTLGSGAVIVSDQEGRTRLSLSARGQGGPGVMLWDSAGRVRMTLGLAESEEPGIRFSDKAEKTTWRAP
jgi:hypothetical protein